MVKDEDKQCGDYLEEIKNLRANSGDDRQIVPTALSLDKLVKEVERSDMANGHGQKGTVYKEAINLYSTLFHRLREKYTRHIEYFTSIDMHG